MKKSYYLFLSLFLVSSASLAQSTIFDKAEASTTTSQEQTFTESFQPIRTELEQWDPIRGPWLSSSLEAMSNNEEIPDRTFPENITPAQMVKALPENTRVSIERVAIANTSGSATDQARWNQVRRVIVRPNPNAGCGTRSARSYGDPHINTFDGARYSFQTVGEFVLAKSPNGMEVQTRQKPQREDFSLNTAVAMRVGGDRVGIYASDYPDGNMSTPVRVNGRAVHVTSSRPYFLPSGGTIRNSGRDYIVDWPSGERVTAQIRRTGNMPFMNVSVVVTDCNQGMYDGLMGNNNGIEGDDFQGMNDMASIRVPNGGGVFGGTSREIEQRRLAFLANSLADRYRVTHASSLFDYPFGMTTMNFTDRSFPRVHRTFNEIPQNRRDAARRQCQNMGVGPRDMNGCIFDQAHLGIEPSVPPRPLVDDPSQGVVFQELSEPKPNVNPNVDGNGRPIPTDTSTPMSDKVDAEEVIEREEPINLTPMPLPEKPARDTRTTSSPRSKPTTISSPEPTRSERPVYTPAPQTSSPEPRRETTSPTRIFGGSSSSGTISRPPTRSTPSTPKPTRTAPRPTTPKPSKPKPPSKPAVKSTGSSRGGR